MRRISKKALQELRAQYPQGTRVELIKMNDPYNTKLVPDSQGTVRCVDDIANRLAFVLAAVILVISQQEKVWK